MSATEDPPVFDPPVLYLLMRTDMLSLNPGKAMAQAHHAGVQFANDYGWNILYQEWRKQAGRYGTVLTLAVESQEQLTSFIIFAQERKGLIGGFLLDPTYPIRDGNFTHQIPCVTCGYVLCRKSEAGFLSYLELHP